MSTASLSDLRRLLAAHRPRRSRDGYPAHVRTAVVTAASELRKAGWTPTRLARELGLAATTLGLWLREPAALTFRPVTVVPTVPPLAPTRTLTLVTPGGWRVEGLDVDSAALLLARLA